MVEIHGRPLLEYQVRWLRSQGIDEILVACGYRHEVISDHFGDGAAWNLRIRYVVEEEPLGRGGALKQAMAQIPHAAEPCVATNGDIITDVELTPVVERHIRQGVLATVVVAPFVSPYGIVEIAESDRVAGFREKPELPYWVNAGIYVLAPQIAPLLPDRGDHETSTFPRLAREGRLAAYRSRAFWRGVDTVKDLTEVAKAIEEGLGVASL